MSKFKRLNLSEAMKLFPLMNEEARQALKGGCELCEQFPGQIYSFDEYERLDKAGEWTGGMVCGMGYVGPTINIWGDMDYCFEHGEYVEDNNCMKCYYGSLEFCMEHEWYFDGLNECEECIIEGYEQAALYAAYTYYEDYFENGDNNEEVDNKGETEGNYGATGDSGNGNQPVDPPKPDSPVVIPDPNQHNGVDVGNSRHFTFNMDGNSRFEGQLQKILGSNSVIKNVLTYFDRGIVHLTFEVGTVTDGQAETIYASNESYHIKFDKKYIDENGWNIILEHDNIGYDWSKVQTKEEALLVAVTHEALHAKHFAVYEESLDKSNTLEGAVNYLLNNGYSREFVEIFYVQNEDGWWDYERSEKNKLHKMHQYIKNHDHGVIDAALNEFRNDFKK